MEGKEVCSGSSSRWQPSKEQLEILESVYSAGVKTPSAEQIQQITSRLSAYGHIEGKNVFYWFQNTKARRRQKIKEHQRLAYLPRFYPPPLFPTTTPNFIPNGVVGDVAAGYYYYPYGMARVEPTRECKTLELFPLHPGCSSDYPPQDEYYYHYCGSANGQGQQEDEGRPGFIDFFSANADGNGCSSTTTVTD